MARWLTLISVAMVALTACPRRKQPERGLELVFSKTGDVRPVVEKRLAQLGLVTRITDDDTHLTVRVPESDTALDVGALGRLLTMPAKLEFCAEATPVGGALCDSDAGVPIGREDPPRSDCYLSGADAGALVQAASAAVKGRVLVGSIFPDAPARTFLADDCSSPRLLEATVKRDDDTRVLALALTFDAPSASRFADLTGRVVRRRLLVVLDDRVHSAPVVMEAIKGGRAMISFGPTATEDEVTQLGRALAGGALPGTLTLERTDTYGPPTLVK